MPQFLRFCIAGVIGFLVDAGIVQLLVSRFDADPYAARVLSFLCALTATWLFNRRYTFTPPAGRSLLAEWAHYAFAMLGGFAVNYATYAAMVYGVPLVRAWPVIGVAAGSVAGLLVNYASSRWWVFRQRPQRPD